MEGIQKMKSGRLVKSLVTGALCISQFQVPIMASEETNPENLALHQPASVSGTEVSGRWGGDMAFDGDRGSSDSRWSSAAYENNPQWIQVDLGEPKTFNTIDLFWEASAGKVYSLQGRNEDSEEWITFYSTENADGEEDYIRLDAPVTYRYVRLYIIEGNGRYSCVSLYEMEIYNYTDEQIVDGSMDIRVPETISQDFTLPVVGETGANISWSTNHEELLNINNENGSVSVTLPKDKNVSATLSAKISSGDYSQTKIFNVLVLCEDSIQSTYQISPTPQKMTMTYEKVNISETINVVLGDSIDEVTKARAQEVLEKHDKKVVFTDTPTTGTTALYIGVNGSKDAADTYTDENNISKDVFTNMDGQFDNHLLSINADGSIVVLGRDSDAAYFALATLDQVLDKEEDGRIPTALFEDYSNTQYRGIVEGFYGFPYSVEDRLSLMEYMKDNKMNTFIYGPKGDPYHLGNWKDEYPESVTDEQRKQGQITRDEMKQLAQAAQKANVDFVWSAHPAMQEGIDFTTDAGVEKGVKDLMNKFEHMYDLGIREFGIFVDDIDLGAAYRDRANHAKLIDKVQKALEEKYNTETAAPEDRVKPLYFVPSFYAFNFGSASQRDAYLRELKNVDEDIVIGFTGSAVFSSINSSLMNQMKELTGREPVMWWNYPVNDNRDAELFMNRINLEYGIENNIQGMRGLLSNPMNQAEASKVSLYGSSDYSWNTKDFNTKENWENSFATYSSDPKVQDAIRTFALHSGATKDESGIKAMYDAFKNDVNAGKVPENAEDLTKEMNHIIDSCNTILALEGGDDKKLSNLAEEIGPWVRKLKSLATIIKDGIEVICSEDKMDTWGAYAEANTLFNGLHTDPAYKVASQEGQGTTITPSEWEALPADLNTRPFAEYIIEQARSHYEEMVPERGDASIYTNTDTQANVEIKEDYAVLKDAGKTTLDPNQYIGINFHTIMPITSVETELPEGCVVEGSVNGKEWTSVNNEENQGFAYVRIKNTSVNPVELDTSTLRVNLVKKTKVINAESSVKLYDTRNYPLSNTYDGNYQTFTWTGANQSVGDTMTFTLNQNTSINDITFVFSGSDCISKDAVVEISEDKQNWQEVGTIHRSDLENNNYVYKTDGKGIKAQYVRLRITDVNANAWLKVYEVEVNKTTNEQLAQPVATLKDNTYVKEVADGTISTSSLIQEDEVLTYQLIKDVKIEDINILYQTVKKGNKTPTVEILGDEGWKLLGELDEKTFYFPVENIRNAKAVRIHTFDNELNVFEIFETGKAYIEADRNALKKAVETKPEHEEGYYTEDSYKAYKDALDDAKTLLEGAELTQEEADRAAQNIYDAIDGLVAKGEIPVVDKQQLKKTFDIAKDLDLTNYTEESVNVFKKALARAENVLADKNATQSDVDDALAQLQNAINNLKLKEDNAGEDNKDDNKTDESIDEETQNGDDVKTGVTSGIGIGLLGLLGSGSTLAFLRKKQVNKKNKK